ncbi:hypothetical protein [Flavobacterium sp. N2270]|uniref:hypothetical protein n=1 Tax=Flavobacterium sp. N2270 TaxID=2986831 RepID=UPI0022243E36|nr:hypothetical protein [Flavobacterium sp. N2270]
MNFLLLFLILMIPVSIFWHLNLIKKETFLHSVVVEELENKFQFELIKQTNIQNKDKVNHRNKIDFKLSIIKQQVELLAAISNQIEN